MLNLLYIECFLLVEFTLLAFLQSLYVLLLFERAIQPLSDLGDTSLGLFALRERLLFGVQLDALSLLEGLGKTLTSCLFPGCMLSLRLLSRT